ncbi:MAG TPA: hypothetical protein PLD02_04565 [Saprospiraceae bacterium]|nr:hypothetical protein [Saprospiraceae bacterium]
MPIKQGEYFSYAIPALTSLTLGLLLFNKDIDLNNILPRIKQAEANNFGYLLIGISYALDLGAIIIPSLDSLVSFTTYLKYLGVFCLLYSDLRFNFLVILAVYVQLLYIGLRGGVFIDFFIWSTFLFFFISLRFKFSFWLRSSFLLLAIPMLFVVQGVKDEYRKATWGSKRETGLETFNDLARQEAGRNENVPLLKTEGVVKTVGRLTQGWHLGLTLKWVPRKKPFVNGSEMMGDIAGSVLPRIIFADKKLVGTQDKFFEYTGYRLRKKTSMTIGVLGDFYINYGRTGSYLMLFVFGASASLFLGYFINRFVLSDPINIIWIPFMFSYFVRANNDFYMVFNCLVKGFLIFLFINFIRKQFWAPQQQKSLA